MFDSFCSGVAYVTDEQLVKSLEPPEQRAFGSSLDGDTSFVDFYYIMLLPVYGAVYGELNAVVLAVGLFSDANADPVVKLSL